MYWNGYYNLDEWDSAAEYLIFDDIPWDRVPVKKAFFGAQKQFVMTDKYKRKKTVHWGKPCIYLCNPEDEPNEIWTDWYQQNIVYVKIENKLY